MTKQMPKTTLEADIMSYVTGFVSAVVLTLLAYAMVVNHWFTGWPLTLAVMGLATIQLVVQLIFFLHLGKGKEARLNFAAFFFMLIVLFIIVGGSLWIMANLNYNMQMTPEQMDKYMHTQSTKGF